MRVGTTIGEVLTAHGLARGGRRATGWRRCWPRPRWTRPGLPVPAPAVRRPAPAGRDRPRARGLAPAAGPRRADQRARRDRAGADPRPGPAAARRARAGLPADHPQPRDRPRAVRADGRALPGPGRRGRAHRRACWPGPRTRTRWRCAPRCPKSTRRARRSRIILPGDAPQARRHARPAARSTPAARWPSTSAAPVPQLRAVAPGRQAACHRAEEVLAGLRPVSFERARGDCPSAGHGARWCHGGRVTGQRAAEARRGTGAVRYLRAREAQRNSPWHRLPALHPRRMGRPAAPLPAPAGHHVPRVRGPRIRGPGSRGQGRLIAPFSDPHRRANASQADGRYAMLRLLLLTRLIEPSP